MAYNSFEALPEEEEEELYETEFRDPFLEEDDSPGEEEKVIEESDDF